MTNPYTFPYKFRNCLNCIHLDQPEGDVAGKSIGGCRKRLFSFGVTEDKFNKMRCGQWYLKQLTDEY